MASLDRLTLRRPDDWHLHLRDGAMLETVLPFTARAFARAIVMPNLVPPVTTVAAAEAYRARILAALPRGADFTPLMTCYLTDGADPDAVARGFREGVFAAVKLYPAHATTNSASGVTDLAKVATVFARMEEIGMPLLIHGEVTDPDIDIFDREAVFIARVLAPLMQRFEGLKIVLEHVTTKDAVDFVAAAGPRLAATVTAHHLVINRNALFGGTALTVDPFGATKWEGVRRFCQLHGLDESRVLAVGNGENDVDLLEHARVACVVRDGCDEALAVATHVIDSPDVGGWASVLDLLGTTGREDAR